MIDHVSYVGIAAHMAFIPLFFWVGFEALALTNVASVLLWMLARRVNRRGRQTMAMALIAGEVVVHSVVAVATLGWQSGFQYYLLPLIPFFLFHHRARLWVLSAASGSVFLVFATLHALYGDLAAALGPTLGAVLYYVNLTVPNVALFVIVYYYRAAAERTERRLLHLASRDPLTGLINRRRMLDRLRDRRAQWDRHHRPFSVIMADIDHFKRVNDHHGHEAGDHVLQEVSHLLQSGVRKEDVVARWGGEEYLVLLTETTIDGASVVAEKLRRRVEEHVVVAEQAQLQITMTFGVATFHADDTLETCIARADSALYEGKTSGRNRVVVSNAKQAESAG